MGILEKWRNPEWYKLSRSLEEMENFVVDNLLYSVAASNVFSPFSGRCVLNFL